MQNIRLDKYILGQSMSKEIVNASEEIRLDLILEPNTNPLGGRVFGKICSNNCSPIKNALIKIMSQTYEPLMHTLSDENGNYSFVNIPPNKSYKIFSIGKGTKLSEGNPFSLTETDEVERNFVLTPDPAMELAIIAGDLFNKDTNDPVNGSIVSLYRINEDNSEIIQGVTFTNEYGQFVFRQISKGNYIIKVNSLGYNGTSSKITITENGEIAPVNIFIEENPLSSKGTVSGVIKNNNNVAIDRADVILYKVNKDNSLKPVAFTKTNENGVYLFAHVPKGIYKIKSNESEIKNVNIKETSSNNSPYFTGFSIISKIKKIKYNIAKGTFSNGVILQDTNIFTEGLGGDLNGEILMTVNVPLDGEYKLTINYLSGNMEGYFKIKINGIGTKTTYIVEKTDSFDISDSKKYDVLINLNAGDNTIKFYNDTNKNSPNIGDIYIENLNQVSKDYKIEKAKLFGFTKIEDSLIKNVGENLGYIILNVDVPNDDYYNFIIKYVTEDNKQSNIAINDIDIEEIYKFNSTGSWDISSTTNKIIPLKLKRGTNSIKIYNKK